MARTVDVAVVGGGPAGAITAWLLARAGLDVVLLERAPAWRWRACGVFTSPASMAGLRRLGLEEADLAVVARPIPAMQVETPAGTSFRLTYGGSGRLEDSAVGVDRGAFDRLLLERARSAGVDVREATTVTGVELTAGARGPAGRGAGASVRLTFAAAERPSDRERDSGPDHDPQRERGRGAAGDFEAPMLARVVVGADGLRSIVAASAGVARRSPLGPRVALTFHVPDPEAAIHDARMVVVDDGYVGLAPVPDGRLNLGIVLGRSWFAALRQDGGPAVARRIVEALPDGPGPRLEFEVLDQVAGVSPLGHRVTRRAGAGWLLVGDAGGFLDPFTGEGLHRAIRSAELAADAIVDALAVGDAASPQLQGYDRAMRATFGTKDLVSRVVQAFLGQARLFDYAARRLADRASVRETMGLVIGDLAPPARALDPRFLAALLRP